MKIKLIIFDGEGVIYSAKKTMKVFEKEYEKFLKNFKVNLEEADKLFFSFRPKIVIGKITLRQAKRIIFKKLGIPLNKVDFWLRNDKKINLKYTSLYKNRKKVLLDIKKKGIKVAVLSDTVQPLRWRLELYKKLGLIKGKHYDKIFLSNVIGYEKPHPKAYLTVIKYFKVRPEETIFVGHDKEEMEGAKKVGLMAITFNELKKLLKIL